MFGYFKNGKRHGIFKKMYWDIECWPYDGVEYNMGKIISIYSVDDVGRYIKTTVENGIAVKCITNQNENGIEENCDFELMHCVST